MADRLGEMIRRLKSPAMEVRNRLLQNRQDFFPSSNERQIFKGVSCQVPKEATEGVKIISAYQKCNRILEISNKNPYEGRRKVSNSELSPSVFEVLTINCIKNVDDKRAKQ